jgi:hypothetical protein
MDKLKFIKIENFYAEKTGKKVTKQITEWERENVCT